jgi:hypothetical protein
MEVTREHVEYEKPRVEDLGSLRELTAGGTVERGQDQRFPTNPKAVKCVVSCFS